MSRILDVDRLALTLSKSRIECGKTQKYMAKAIGRSVGTIQNWESGYGAPDLIQTMEWFEILGVNPLRYMLDFVFPDVYDRLNGEVSDELIDQSLRSYFESVATPSEKRKLAYCIFGKSGSSWHCQLEMLTAHNHTSLRSRVNAAQTIMDSYDMEKARGELIGLDHVMPDEELLRNAIKAGKQSVIDGKTGY